MAQRRRPRDDREPGARVSNRVEVRGNRNEVMGGAAGRDLTQNMRSGPALEGLQELRAALASQVAQVADIEQANETVDAIEEELTSGQPRRPRLNMLLTGLTTAVGAATGVLTVVDKIRATVNALFT